MSGKHKKEKHNLDKAGHLVNHSLIKADVKQIQY